MHVWMHKGSERERLSKPIKEIEGIEPVYAKKFADMGIHTVHALVLKGCTISGRKELAEKIGVSETAILEWVNLADLFRIKGIREEHSNLLEEAGVDTVVKLSNSVPENLHARLKEVNELMKLVGRLPSLYTVKKWIEEAKKLPRVIEYAPHPFSLSLREFRSLELDEVKKLLRRVYDLCEDLLEEAWENGFRQIVICDGKVIFESKDIEDIPNETIEQLAKEHDKACYVFSAPDVVEESAWTSVGHGDFYPTLCVYLGTEDLEESEIIKSFSPIYADLDTGNPSYKIFNAKRLAEQLTRFTPTQMRQGFHLNQAYIYFCQRVKMCVQDVGGNIASFIYNVRLVEDWDGCALLQASPNREGFVGRDVLCNLRIRLKLDSIEKITQILDVS